MDEEEQNAAKELYAFSMKSEPHRAQRYPFVARVEPTDLQSEGSLKAQTSDLNLFGCHVETKTPFPVGTRVRLRIAHGGATFEALGRVVHTQPYAGMGVSFTAIEPNRQAVLDKWAAELRRT